MTTDSLNNQPVRSMFCKKSVTVPGILLVLYLLGIGLISISNNHPEFRAVLFTAGFAVSFIAMIGLRSRWPTRWGFGAILLVACALRLFLLGQEPSDDLYRYVWEGRIQLEGLNPYSVAPADSCTLHLRDEVWSGINHKEYPTIYGPLAQLVFKLSALVSGTVLGMKIIILLFDLATLVLLWIILSSYKRRSNELLLYALHPITLYSFGIEGHLECMVLFFLVAGFLSYRQRWYALLFISLGAAVAIKMTALMFLPLFIQKKTIRYLPFFVIPLLAAIPYGLDITTLFTVMVKFGAQFRFNGFVYTIADLCTSGTAALLISVVLFAGIYGWHFFLTPDPVRASAHVGIAFLLTSPTAHPWYFTIVAVVVVLYPVRSWILLSATVGLSWLVSFRYWLRGVWRENLLYFFMEYIPACMAGSIGTFKRPVFSSENFGPVERVSIIIPVVNDAQELHACLKSIQPSDSIVYEMLVVDGGSEDSTRAIAEADKRVQVLQAQRGRGIQIAEGVCRATGDLVIIVHADARIEKNGINRIVTFCNVHQHIVGGSVTSVFDKRNIRFRFISLLNNIRSRISGISFGDQVQFFRKEALGSALPRVMLMEDIEIAMLLKERGEIAVIPSVAQSSTRRWQSTRYAGNMLLVIRLTGWYLIKRRLGLLSIDNKEFYKAYYGGK